MENEPQKPDWVKLRQDVNRKIDYLAIAWAAECGGNVVEKKLKDDLYIPVLRLLGEFCASVTEASGQEAGGVAGTVPARPDIGLVKPETCPVCGGSGTKG